jgi:hypothetical protein
MNPTCAIHPTMGMPEIASAIASTSGSSAAEIVGCSDSNITSMAASASGGSLVITVSARLARLGIRLSSQPIVVASERPSWPASSAPLEIWAWPKPSADSDRNSGTNWLPIVEGGRSDRNVAGMMLIAGLLGTKTGMAQLRRPPRRGCP